MNIREMGGLSKTAGDVGIEIEVEGENLPGNLRGTRDFDKLWLIAQDGSLRGESYEYVLRKPCKIERVGKVLSTVADSYKKCKSIINNSVRTGVHIHVNCQELTMKQVMNFTTLYFVLEELLLNFCDTTRRGNLFCLRAKDAEYQIYNLQGVLESRDLHNFADRNVRYSSLNLCSLPRFGSMEFRSLEGGDLDKISQWASILYGLREVACTYDNPISIVESMSQDGYDNFLTYVLGSNYVHFAKMSEVDGMILSGARQAQDMAYNVDWSKIDEGWRDWRPRRESSTEATPPRRRRPPRANPTPTGAEEPLHWDTADPITMTQVEAMITGQTRRDVNTHSTARNNLFEAFANAATTPQGEPGGPAPQETNIPIRAGMFTPTRPDTDF